MRIATRLAFLRCVRGAGRDHAAIYLPHTPVRPPASMAFEKKPWLNEQRHCGKCRACCDLRWRPGCWGAGRGALSAGEAELVGASGQRTSDSLAPHQPGRSTRHHTWEAAGRRGPWRAKILSTGKEKVVAEVAFCCPMENLFVAPPLNGVPMISVGGGEPQKLCALRNLTGLQCTSLSFH